MSLIASNYLLLFAIRCAFSFGTSRTPKQCPYHFESFESFEYPFVSAFPRWMDGGARLHLRDASSQPVSAKLTTRYLFVAQCQNARCDPAPTPIPHAK